jgi:hypothetical protein
LESLGLLHELKQAGGYEMDDFVLRRWETGDVIVKKPLKKRVKTEFGAEWV